MIIIIILYMRELLLLFSWIFISAFLIITYNDIVQGKFLLIQNAIHLMMLPNLNSNEPIREAAECLVAPDRLIFKSVVWMNQSQKQLRMWLL